MTPSDDELLALLKLRILLKSGSPKPPEFLSWTHARLRLKHKENPQVDYMLRLGEIAEVLKQLSNLLGIK